jgi:hypothetical protein
MQISGKLSTKMKREQFLRRSPKINKDFVFSNRKDWEVCAKWRKKCLKNFRVKNYIIGGKI